MRATGWMTIQEALEMLMEQHDVSREQAMAMLQALWMNGDVRSDEEGREVRFVEEAHAVAA